MRKYNKFALFILGMTGSGKSRVANQISLLNDFTLISGGSIFRNLAESDSGEDAKIAREIMSKGIGAPNELVIRLYRKSLEQLTPDSVVFDGNPKNLNQFFEIGVAIAMEKFPTMLLKTCFKPTFSTTLFQVS